jgi:hypothetical protein
MKHFARHLPHYFLLIGILFFGFGGLILFSYDRTFQVGIAIATAVSYVFWGIIHHHLHRDLHLEVVVEYIAVACLGLVVLFSIISRL